MRKKILLAGLYVPGSGLTNVLEALRMALSETFEVSCLGFAPTGRTGPGIGALHDCSMTIHNSRAQHFQADQRWLNAQFEHAPPDTVLLIAPAYVGKIFLQQLQAWRPNTKIVLYLPIEGSLANDEFAPIIALTDVCVLYTEVARLDIQTMCERALAANPGYRAPDLTVIGHGTDPASFFPDAFSSEQDRRRAAREALYGTATVSAEPFIILNINKPYWRKRLDITISGFAQFAAGKTDVLLHLHTGRRSDWEDAALRKLIDSSGVAEQIRLTPELITSPIFGRSELNTLYNACDVGLSTAMGEGWGLGIFEHAMTRCAVVVPDHTSFRENWSGAAWLMPVSGTEFVFYEAANMHTVSASDVCAALEALYHDDVLRAELSEAAYRRSTQEMKSWQKIGQLFSHYL